MNTEDKPYLQLPCVISKFTSLKDGGYSLTLHVPETATKEVKELVGTENKVPYIVLFVKGE